LSRAFGRSGGEDDDWTAWLLDVGQEMAAVALNGVVLFRELGGLARDGVHGYAGPAGTRLVELTYDLGKQVEQGELDDALWKAATKTGGALFRIPAMQIQRSVDGWVALSEGRTRNPMALLVGPNRAAR
jgi:hypothetical protein